MSRPVGLLEILVGRTRHVDFGSAEGKIVVSLNHKMKARQTAAVTPRPDAEWNQGFQVRLVESECIDSAT